MNEQELPIVEVYAKAHALFQDKERWTQGYFNKDKEGNNCPWREGFSFCALGALCFFGNGHSHKAQCCLQRISEHLYGGRHIQQVNDEDPEGYEKVLKALEFGMEFWKDRQPVEEELGASVEQVMGVRKALQLSMLPETTENVRLAHQAYRDLGALIDQAFGGNDG